MPDARTAEDTVDSNVASNVDEGDGERGCEVVDCSGLQALSAGKGLPADLAVQLAGHVLRSWHQGTSPWGDGCASNAGLS